jgi:ABC-type multidrug transport system permease subunit
MIAGMYEQDFIAYMIFGLILNFVFSILFGIYLSKNIGMQEMIESKGNKQQSLLVSLSLFIPYAKMLITLYRVSVLQIFFLNKGFSHKEFWVYMTNERKENS